MISSEHWLAHPGSVGRHWQGGKVWILDRHGNELPPGQDGRIYFQASALGRFRYLNQPEATAAAYAPGDTPAPPGAPGDTPGPPGNENRFTLGDIGHLDEDGWLYVTDRDKDLVISGGVNISPREVENVLLDHPAVADAGVVGVPDTDLGERLVAAVERQAGAAPVDGAGLIAFCRERIAAFKCPKAVVFLDELPRSEAGKLDKRALRARLSSE
jgi:long-chain acyl-CoA synthetase